jgi:hypothetical protein
MARIPCWPVCSPLRPPARRPRARRKSAPPCASDTIRSLGRCPRASCARSTGGSTCMPRPASLPTTRPAARPFAVTSCGRPWPTIACTCCPTGAFSFPSSAPGRTAPARSRSRRWLSSPGWRPTCRLPGATSRATSGCFRRIVGRAARWCRPGPRPHTPPPTTWTPTWRTRAAPAHPLGRAVTSDLGHRRARMSDLRRSPAAHRLGQDRGHDRKDTGRHGPAHPTAPASSRPPTARGAPGTWWRRGQPELIGHGGRPPAVDYTPCARRPRFSIRSRPEAHLSSDTPPPAVTTTPPAVPHATPFD